MKFKIITSEEEKKIEIEKPGSEIIEITELEGKLKVFCKNMQLVNLSKDSFEIVMFEKEAK